MNMTMMIGEVANEVVKCVSLILSELVRIGVSIGFTPSEVRLFLIIALAVDIGVNAGIRTAHQNAIFARRFVRRLREKQREINKKIYKIRDAVKDLYEPSHKEGENVNV